MSGSQADEGTGTSFLTGQAEEGGPAQPRED